MFDRLSKFTIVVRVFSKSQLKIIQCDGIYKAVIIPLLEDWNIRKRDSTILTLRCNYFWLLSYYHVCSNICSYVTINQMENIVQTSRIY